MPQRTLALTTLTTVAALAIAGCSSSDSGSSAGSSPAATSSAATSPTSDTASPTTPATSETTSATTKSAPAPRGPAVTQVYADSYKSVFTMTDNQLTAFTGVDVRTGNVDQIVAALGETARWKSQRPTARYANQIAAAAKRETGSVRHAVQAVRRDASAKVRVYVAHNPHASIAHFGIQHDDD